MLRALAVAFSLLPDPLQDERAINNGASNEHLSPLEEVITELADVLDMADKHPGTRETVGSELEEEWILKVHSVILLKCYLRNSGNPCGWKQCYVSRILKYQQVVTDLSHKNAPQAMAIRHLGKMFLLCSSYYSASIIFSWTLFIWSFLHWAHHAPDYRVLLMANMEIPCLPCSGCVSKAIISLTQQKVGSIVSQFWTFLPLLPR